jgi:peptidoglycan/LPS O-acetylase OafA/YrhL
VVIKGSCRSVATLNVMTQPSSRIEGLDGLRAVAVMTVLVSHIFIAAPGVLQYSFFRTFARGGFLGVNIFFVMSGFLITSRLLQDKETGGQINLRKFYAHRALRIFPAVTVFLAAHYFYAVKNDFPLSGTAANEFAMTKATFLQYANYAVYKNPMTQFIDNVSLWSLSIEGQFYIAVPIVVFVLFRKNRSNYLPVGIIVLSIGILAIQRGIVYNDLGWFATYIRTDTRIESLIIGMLGAVLMMKTNVVKPTFLRYASFPAVIVVVVIVLYGRADGSFMWFGGMTLFDVACLVIVLALAHQAFFASRILCWKPIAWVGVISYGLYIWQIPVFRIIQRHGEKLSNIERLVLAMSATFLLSALSWYLIERPAMRSQWGQRLAGTFRSKAQ